jgi:hypothetical protein
MRRRTTTALVSALLVALAGTAAVLAAPLAQAAAGCRVDYRVDQWPGGFVGYLTVNVGDTAVHGWTVTWTYPARQRITSAWQAQVGQSGIAITVRNESYNGEVPAGGSVQFGVQGTFTGSNPAPADFALNGVPCDGTPGPSSPSAPPSSPSAPSSSPSTGPSTSPPPDGAGCGTAALCDGFENQTGPAPSGAWSVSFPDCQGAGAASVDTAVAHTGTRSVRVDGAAGYCNHVFVGTGTSALGSVWYARFYVRHTTALPAAHVTLLAMNDANDGDRDLRMGGQNGALQWNRESDDATLPEQSPVGVALSVPLPVDQWTCVEFAVDGTDGTMQTWVNGTDVAGLHADGVPTPNIDSQWLRRAGWRPSLTDLRLGWESYGEGSDTLWFDDVALGTSRIGC